MGCIIPREKYIATISHTKVTTYDNFQHTITNIIIDADYIDKKVMNTLDLKLLYKTLQQRITEKQLEKFKLDLFIGKIGRNCRIHIYLIQPGRHRRYTLGDVKHKKNKTTH